jgi:hypothetical protein
MSRSDHGPPVISVMLAVTDAPVAVAWYERALGATGLWSLGSVAGLELGGAPFFVGEPEANGWESPTVLGTTSVRIEVFCNDPDALVARALARARRAVSTTCEITRRRGAFTGRATSSTRSGICGSWVTEVR